MFLNRTAFALMTFLTALASFGTAQDEKPVDILLRGATLYDGIGEEPTQGDVAIRGDRIVAIGKSLDIPAVWKIDCSKHVICPGFIDLHNHADRRIVKAETRANMNFVTQGCTTVVTGNCGSGPVDVAAYYKILDEHGAGTNVAHLLPQGSLRDDVMGTALRKPTDKELAEMAKLAEKAMRDGAWGMSTGLIYVPSSYAETDELISLAKIVSRHGGIYASHIRGEGSTLLTSVAEALQIGRDANLPVHVSHFKSSGRSHWGLVRRAAEEIQKARDAGQVVTADQYPYIASSTSLDATLLPAWARAGGREELLKRFEDAEIGPRLRDHVAQRLDEGNGGESIRIARYSPNPEWAGQSLRAIAETEKRDAIEVAYEIFRGGGAQIVNFSMSEDDVRHIMAIDWVATASDGGAYLPGADRPHPRNYGTFPRKIRYYSLDEKVIPHGKAIRSATSLPADILGLKDRGRLQVGQFADVVVFDPKKIRDEATFSNPHQYSTGIRFVFVNGTPAIAEGIPTGTLSGRPLQHQSTAEE
ncbi:MAG: D-aminoacylase [Planctomycetota bacterium]|nr:D-aminoacylase [Planctomycetota bacterium]MDA1248318.1 D-aminoacylase [Planctomycetota bacterium]